MYVSIIGLVSVATSTLLPLLTGEAPPRLGVARGPDTRGCRSAEMFNVRFHA